MTSVYPHILNTVLPGALRLTRSRFLSRARQMSRRQFWSREQLKAWQHDRLCQLLTHAYERVALYRTAFDEFDLAPDDFKCVEDLRRFPVLTKDAVRANFPDRMLATGCKPGDCQYVGSGGTTNRVMVLHDFQRRDVGLSTDLMTYAEDAPFRLGQRQVCIPPDECSVHCGTEKRQQVSLLARLRSAGARKWFARDTASDLRGILMDQWIRRATVLPPLYTTEPEEVTENCREAIEAIKRLRPTMLVALPEYLRDLAHTIHQDQAVLPPLKVVRPMGANLPAAWKPNIESAFRCPLREHYGARETGGMAFDCRCRNGLHILSDQVAIEVEWDGRPAEEGELGSILVTDLNNFATPLIRYRIGDLGRIDYTECPCGRSTPRLVLEGRECDAIGGPDRLVSSEEVANVLYQRHRIDRFQLVQSQDGSLAFKMIDAAHDECRDDVAQTLRDLFPAARRIRIRTVSHIAPEASGKFRCCKAAQQRIRISAGLNASLG